MFRRIRILIAALLVAAVAAGVAPAQDKKSGGTNEQNAGSGDVGGEPSHGVDYVIGFICALGILVPVCKPSRPF